MKQLLLLVSAFFCCTMSAQTLLINELMQSNVDCIMDDLNEFPDSWVELFNAGNTQVNLKNYRLGTTTVAEEAWQLPSMTVAPQQHVLVYCDKAAKGRHTPFRLESGKGCEVYLFQDDTIIDQVTELKKQPAPNIAYGRESDGSNEWGYMLTATPEAKNKGGICDRSHILGEPVFSVPGKVTTASTTIKLTISLPEDAPEGTVIRYTTDGSEPTASSSTFPSQLTISQTKVVRAKLFCNGWLSPRSTTQSYLFFPRDLTLPVVSITTDPKYMTDPKIGIYVTGSYKSGKANYEYNWRRPANFELFEGESTASVINQLGEMRVMGGATRSAALKSLALYAHKRFGTKRFEYEFFPEDKPGLTDFKSIGLRNAGNDFDYLYQRDAIIQRTMARHADLDWQAYRAAIVYINGTYRGMLNIRERSNDNNIYTNYDGLEDIDMVENWSELKEGTWDNYNQFRDFYNEHGHTLAEYEEWIDWREFINLMAMNLYYNNQDFPGNNFMMWRPRTEDGMWRFVAKDTDFGLGLYGSSASYNTIKWLYTPNYDPGRAWANTYEHTRLFRRMMEDEDFSREFIDRCAIYMGDFLNERGTREVWDPMYEEIKYEYPNHRKLFNQWWPNYDQELAQARSWLSKRTEQFYKQLANFYELGTPVALTVNSQLCQTDSVVLTMNGVALQTGHFDGKFFAGRSISLQGQPADESKMVTGWKLQEISTSGGVSTREVNDPLLTLDMPQCAALTVEAVLGDNTGISDMALRQWQWHRSADGIALSGVPRGVRVSLYDFSGRMLSTTLSTGQPMNLPVSHNHPCLLKVGSETIKVQ